MGTRSRKLKRITAVMLSVSLLVTGINFNITSYAATENQQLEKNEIQLTEKDKNEARKQDKKIKKELKKTKDSKKNNKKATIIKEIEELRTANSTTYLLSDGSRKLEICGENIRFKENGKFVDYDSKLKKVSKQDEKSLKKDISDKSVEGKYAFVNKSGDAKNYFPKKLDEDSSIVLTKDKYSISFSPVINEKVDVKKDEENPVAVIDEQDSESSTIEIEKTEEDNLTYKKSDGLEYKYTSLKDGVKEEIILNEKPNNNVFEFKLDLKGTKIKKVKGSKEIQLFDSKTNKYIAYIGEPNIKDGKGNITYKDVDYDISKNSTDEYTLKVIVDSEYLDKASYPVTIDPTVWWVDSRLEAASVTDFPYTLDTNRRYTSTIVVRNKGINFYPYLDTTDTCYIDTSGIDENNAIVGTSGTFYGSDVKEAYLSITEKTSSYHFNQTAKIDMVPANVEVRTPVSTWSPETITWNNHPGMGDTVWSQFKCTGVTGTNHKVDLKDWAQAVSDRKIENTGLALKAIEEGTGIVFYSSSSENTTPMSLTIVYENPHIGDKSIYSYEDFNTPNGNGKVELSQGNFLYTQNDFALPTPQLGLQMSRTYNSRNSEQTNFGIGWSCDYDARIADYKGKSLTYVDGSGAIYGFGMQKGTEWVCNENTDLSLEIASSKQTRVILATENKPSSTVSFTSEYVITDKEKVKRYFDGDGKICLIEEANGTFIYIKHHKTTGLIQSIYSNKGQSIEFEFSYINGEYYVSKTTLVDGSSFNYVYTNKRLSKVIHKSSEGNEIVYNYGYNENGQMSKITDALGSEYKIEYDGKSVASLIYPDNSRIEIYTNYEPLKTRVYTKNPNNMVLHYEEYEFDNDGKVIKKTNDNGKVYEYTYDGSLLTDKTEKVQYYELQENIVKKVIPIEEDENLTEEMEYNDRNNVITETDEEGNVIEYTYGDEANPDLETKVKETSAEGKVVYEVEYSYDSNGNVIKETDHIEKTIINYSYDKDGNVTESVETLVDNSENIDKGLNTSTYEDSYDVDGNNLTSKVKTGSINQSTENTYDLLGRVKTSKDEKNIVTSYEYDEFGRVKSTVKEGTDNKKATTETSYDLNGRIIKEIDKLGRIATYKYDDMGRVVSKTLTYGDETRTTTTSYGYVDNFYVVTGTGSNKRLPSVEVVEEKNANNEVIAKTYTDSYGQIVREERDGICKDYTYDKQGNVFTTYSRGAQDVNTVSPKLVVTLYDKNGRLTDTIQNPVYRNGSFTVDVTKSIVMTNKYDARGNLVEETDGKGNKTIYEYNEEDRLVKTSIDDGTGTSNDTVYEYDIQNKDNTGKIVSTTDKTINALGNISETIKNGAGQVLSIEDKGNSKNIRIVYEYDASGNVTKENKSDGSYIKYTYNTQNKVVGKYEYSTDNKWKKLSSYTYNEDDLLNKVSEYNVVDGRPIAYRYTFYEYDALGRMIGNSEIYKTELPNESEIKESKQTYKYNIEDKLVEIRYPNTSKDKLKGIVFEYNDYKWLTKIKGIVNESNNELLRDIRTYDYYNDGKIKTINDYRGFLNGINGYIKKDYEYDVFDRVTKMTYSDSKLIESVLEQHTYSYDKNSNIIREENINNYPSDNQEKVDEVKTYLYDNLDRLVSTKKVDNIRNTESTKTYEYDKVGNCIKTTENGITVTNVYNNLNQLTRSETTKDESLMNIKFYVYDSNGNQTIEQTVVEAPNISETIQKEYDINNQLTKVTCRNGGVDGEITYTQENVYNYAGKRICKKDNDKITNYYYQGDVLLYTTDENGNKTSQNIIGLQENIIATIRYENGSQHAYFYNKDAKTSVENIVDENGSGVTSYTYTDYGETSKYSSKDFYNEICYTSEVYDELTGLYYLSARYYNPENYSFITQDSYRGEQKEYNTWNLYAYCGENPINYVDPSGHKREKIYGVYLEVKRKKNDKEKTKYVEALYKIANKSQFKSKYKLFENEVARKVLVAQSAWESGYGTSYSAVNRNNIFGFVGYTYKSLKASIEAYAWQLNNGKQKGYKQARKYLKKNKNDAKGYVVRFAHTYCASSSAMEYTKTILNMIDYIKNRKVWN